MDAASNIQLCTPEQAAFVKKELGLTDEQVKDAVRSLREWLEKQPHLPNNIDDCRIERLFINCKCRMERAKAGIDAYFSMKHRVPELLMNRDPLHPDIVHTENLLTIVTMPQVTERGYRVHVNFGVSPDPEDLRFEAYLKLSMMELEILMAEDYSLGDIVIFDIGPSNMSHILKVDFSLLRELVTLYRTAYCRRLKALHLINASQVVESLMILLKMVVPKKLYDRVHVHSPGSATLFDHVPRSAVPDELGGSAGPVEKFRHILYNKVCNNRSWFLEQDKYISDESKRPDTNFNKDTMVGSFRKLCVD